MVAKTIVGAEKFITTSRRGPCLEDIQSRRIWSLTTGKLLDECDVENTPHSVLNRRMMEPDNIRIEPTLKCAETLYKRKGPDVVEGYSRPRLCQEASSQKFSCVTMRPGWSLDLTMPDPSTGEPWDLSDLRVQSRVVKFIKESDPFCIVDSPPCTPSSRLQELNKGRRCPKVAKAEFEAGRRHIQFCLRLYDMQMSRDKHFAHEHPSTSTAWSLPEVVEFIMKKPVEVVTTHMCEFDMKSKDELGEWLVQKGTKIMTSSPEIAKRVARKCSGEHRHVPLIAGEARAAQVCPRAFCEALCMGIMAQKKLDELGLVARPIMSVDRMQNIAGDKITSGEEASEELPERHGEDVVAYDDLTGDEWDPKRMRQARMEEIAYFKKMGVYDKVSVEEAWKETGKYPIAVRWVDINKGDSINHSYRSRLVANEFNTGVNPDLYVPRRHWRTSTS